MKGQEQLFSSASDEWSTPIELFKVLHKQFEFTLDPCAMPDNGLNLPQYFTKEDDGLGRSWKGHTAFVNPPYSEVAAWTSKCVNEYLRCDTESVMLIPARTDTRYWHGDIFKYATGILFIKGRLKFGGHTSAAPFPSALVSFGPDLRPLQFLGACMGVNNE